MYIFKKLFIFIILFTAIFILFRIANLVPMILLKENITGISYLYSTIGLIFSIISAFVIQNQWVRWTKLETAVKSETDSLWELVLYMEQVPHIDNKQIKEVMGTYLHSVVGEGWMQMENGEPSHEAEKALRNLQRTALVMVKSAPEDASFISSFVQGVTNSRNDRLHYSAGHLPYLLYVLIIVSTSMVIFLSLFIAVENIYLDYIFTMSIALLGFLVFTVIEDLNQPFRPGSWHITNKEYRILLKRVETKT
jgi:hypothetical protein